MITYVARRDEKGCDSSVTSPRRVQAMLSLYENYRRVAQMNVYFTL